VSKGARAGAQGPAPKIQRAEDIGRKAWTPGGAAHGQEKARLSARQSCSKLQPCWASLCAGLRATQRGVIGGGAPLVRAAQAGSGRACAQVWAHSYFNGDAAQRCKAAVVPKQRWRAVTHRRTRGRAQAIKAVKGILNKLTPEKFERLLEQLVGNVADAEVLHATIRLVFENAVAQPTFVPMYAELCDRLSKARPRAAL